jgi:hypothetical protein
MVYSTLSFLLLSLSLLPCFAESDAAAKGRAKAEELRYLSSVYGGLIQLNSTGYDYYVLDYPRPYTLVVLFNADPKKYKCGPCEDISMIMKQVIYSYNEAGGDLPYTSPEGVRSRAVFFAQMEYKPEHQTLFKQHGFASVPNLLVTHPKSVVFDGESYFFKREDAWEFHAGSEIHPHKVVEFINNRASRNVIDSIGGAQDPSSSSLYSSNIHTSPTHYVTRSTLPIPNLHPKPLRMVHGLIGIFHTANLFHVFLWRGLRYHTQVTYDRIQP